MKGTFSHTAPLNSGIAAPRDALASRTQAGSKRLLCLVMLLPLYYLCTWAMRFYGRFSIANIDEVRRVYREAAKDPSPLVICANHLTFIDSALILWALGTGPWYLMNFKHFSWNLPAGDFFKEKAFHRFMGLISKCIFIYRNGSKEHKESVVELCTQLVGDGEVITIFPEGKRSRTGRFDPDALSYGVGKIVTGIGGRCRVLCVYVRGHEQHSYSNYPVRGSKFHLAAELIHVRTAKSGRDGYAEVVGKIGTTLKSLEDAYFATKPIASSQAPHA